MHPVLLEIFGLKFHTYGVAMATAFIVGIYLASRRAPRERIDPNLVVDVSLWLFVGTLLGGRIGFILEHLGEYREHPGEIFKIWKGGLVFYGGFFGAMILATMSLKVRKAPMLGFFDLLAPYAGLGYGIHRSGGCCMAGCCYGQPTDLPWGIAFHNPSSLVPKSLLGVKLHPTQLYEAMSGFLIFFLILFLRGRKRRDGDMTALFFFTYGLNRFVIEFFRGERTREIIWSLTNPQIISIFTIIVAGIIFWRARRKSGTEPGH